MGSAPRPALPADAMADNAVVVPSVWAVYVRRSEEAPWRLEAFSVLGAHRALALAEREHARRRIVGAQYRVLEYASIAEIPDRLAS